MEYDCSVGRWIDAGEDIEILCTRCRRTKMITADYIAATAKSRDERQNFYCIRLRCSVCGGAGVKNGFAYSHLW